jgi:DHA1 family multidrug resistance protein-like MFS transporter
MLQGIFTGTVSAAQALVASQSPRDRLGFSLGVMQTAVFTGTSIGPLAGGVVADAFGFRMSFVTGGAILFLGGVLVALYVQEEARFAERRAASAAPLLHGMWDAFRTPTLPPMIGAIFAVQFAVTVVLPVLPQFIQYLQGPAGHAATATGLVLGAAGLAGALSSVSVGSVSDRLGYKTVLVAATLVAGLLSIPQYFVTATWQLLVLRVLVGLAMGAALPSASALIATLVPAERRGTVYGLTGSANSIGFATGPLSAALAVGLFNMQSVFLLAGAVLCAIAVWVAAMVRPDRKAVPVIVTGSEEAAVRPTPTEGDAELVTPRERE